MCEYVSIAADSICHNHRHNLCHRLHSSPPLPPPSSPQIAAAENCCCRRVRRHLHLHRRCRLVLAALFSPTVTPLVVAPTAFFATANRWSRHHINRHRRCHVLRCLYHCRRLSVHRRRCLVHRRHLVSVVAAFATVTAISTVTFIAVSAIRYNRKAEIRMEN